MQETRPARRCAGDRGAALVEFALILPFLALITCGTIDLGRYYGAWIQTKNAAREGALYGQNHPLQQRRTGTCTEPDNIEDRAMQELDANDSDPTFTVVITPAIASGCEEVDTPGSTPIPAGTDLTVTVSRHVALLTPLMSNILGDIDITAKVTVEVIG